MGKTWLIVSGKGGVGKSTATAALGCALAAKKKKVCLLDGDIGLRDLDALLGVENQVVYDLLDLCRGECMLSQALLSTGRDGLYLLPAAQMARCKELDKLAFQKVLTELKTRFDHILIDSPAGIERGLRGLLGPEVDEILLLCTSDDVCLRDAERVVSLLNDKAMPRPRLIVNRLKPQLIAKREMQSASLVASVLDLTLMGEVPEDADVCRALLHHRSLMDSDCEAAAAFRRIADRMNGESAPFPAYGSERRYWYRRVGRRIRRRKEVQPS